MNQPKHPTLRIIRPSSREQTDLLGERLEEFRRLGFPVLYDDLPPDPTWPYVAAPALMRAQALTGALAEAASDVVLCARGGYGASDLLPLIDWKRLEGRPPKILVGFSDVSALHAALTTKLGWPGLHAPMPATALWKKNGVTHDVDAMLAILDTLHRGADATHCVKVERIGAPTTAPINGRLFGGCFTVLTNLLGTPFFPASLAGRVVFFEDTDEHPARLMRAFNQWIQTGALIGVQALVIGHLRNLGDKIEDSAAFVYDRFAERSPVPVFRAPSFGHTSPNEPLMLGAEATIERGTLTWHFDPKNFRKG